MIYSSQGAPTKNHPGRGDFRVDKLVVFHQPIWKSCLSNWKISPGIRGWTLERFDTTKSLKSCPKTRFDLDFWGRSPATHVEPNGGLKDWRTHTLKMHQWHLKRRPIYKGITSSNHPFSGDMLVFRGSIYLRWMIDCYDGNCIGKYTIPYHSHGGVGCSTPSQS